MSYYTLPDEFPMRQRVKNVLPKLIGLVVGLAIGGAVTCLLFYSFFS